MTGLAGHGIIGLNESNQSSWKGDAVKKVKIDGQWVVSDGARMGCSCGGNRVQPCCHMELAQASMATARNAVARCEQVAQRAMLAVSEGEHLLGRAQKGNRAKGYQNMGSIVQTTPAPSQAVTVVEVVA